MFRLFRFLSVVLAVALLAGVLVAFTPGDEPEAKAALGPLQAVTLSGADFHPRNDQTNFDNYGVYVRSDSVQLARIPFPAEVVMITSVKARVYDNSAGSGLCVNLYRARPGDAAEDYLGSECTFAASAANPQTLSIPVFKRVGRYQTAYLWGDFLGAFSVDLQLYGATVFYRVVS